MFSGYGLFHNENFTMRTLIPDWYKRWTAAKAEEELVGFRFRGEGTYITATDVILVVPCGYTHPEESAKYYYFNVYNDLEILNTLATLNGGPKFVA